MDDDVRSVPLTKEERRVLRDVIGIQVEEFAGAREEATTDPAIRDIDTLLTETGTLDEVTATLNRIRSKVSDN